MCLGHMTHARTHTPHTHTEIEVFRFQIPNQELVNQPCPPQHRNQSRGTVNFTPDPKHLNQETAIKINGLPQHLACMSWVCPSLLTPHTLPLRNFQDKNQSLDGNISREAGLFMFWNFSRCLSPQHWKCFASPIPKILPLRLLLSGGMANHQAWIQPLEQ